MMSRVEWEKGCWLGASDFIGTAKCRAKWHFSSRGGKCWVLGIGYWASGIGYG